jgi:heme oxygenase
MRARENKARDEELGLVLAWLARRAEALAAVAQDLATAEGEVAKTIRERCRSEGETLRVIVGYLERKEHRR